MQTRKHPLKNWERDRLGRRSRCPADCFLPQGSFSARGRKGRSRRPRSQNATAIIAIYCLLAFFGVFSAAAQTNPPPVSCFRSYVNDIPNEPLVTVTITGASNVSCLTIEEDLPSPATAVSVSGDGVYLPALNAVRWGPYFNTAATNVSYRLTGLAGSYPVNGGSWMDGAYYFSPGVDDDYRSCHPAAATLSRRRPKWPADVYAGQRQRCASERDHFSTPRPRGDLLHFGWHAADRRIPYFTRMPSHWLRPAWCAPWLSQTVTLRASQASPITARFRRL